MIYNRNLFPSSAKELVKLPILLFAFTLGGCQSLTTEETQPVKVAHVDQLRNWTARGKMMVASNDEKVSGYFFWKQSNKDFEFSLDTVIGTNIVALEFKNGIATIDVDNKQYQDTDPEHLVYRLTGHRLPIQHLSDWFIAKLNKRQAKLANAKYDGQARLSSFRYQDNLNDWLISYSGWTQTSKIALPKGIQMKSQHNRVKISISNWLIQG